MASRPVSAHPAAYVALLLASGAIALPFLWMISTSLKTGAEVLTFPPNWLPDAPQWSNYAAAWRAAPFGRFYLNSLITATASTALQIGLGGLMAYAFAHVRFPAKGALLIAVLATMMIPDEMRLVPNYLTVTRLGWYDAYWALIIPPAAHAFPVFVLYQQFRMAPRDLLEAARIDGAGHVRILLQVVAPLSRPVLVAMTLIAFLGRWNDYLWPLVVTDRVAMRTLPIGLAYLRDMEAGSANWHLLMAGTVIVVAPLLLAYALGQRWFVAGLTQGALKG